MYKIDSWSSLNPPQFVAQIIFSSLFLFLAKLDDALNAALLQYKKQDHNFSPHKLSGDGVSAVCAQELSVFTLTGNSRHSQPRSQPCTANLWPGFGEICCFFSRSSCLHHRITSRPIRGQDSSKLANQRERNTSLYHTSSQPQSDL